MTRTRKINTSISTNEALYYAIIDTFKYWIENGVNVTRNVRELTSYFSSDFQTTSDLYITLVGETGKKQSEIYLKRCVTQAMSFYLES